MKLETSHDALVVNFSVLERVASGCLGGMRIPRDQSGRAHIDVLRHNWRQLRIPGAFIPGVVKAGIYAWSGRREFWLVHRWQLGRLVIELKSFALRPPRPRRRRTRRVG